MATDRNIARRMARYLAGAVLVRLADEGARVALVVLALERTGSAAVGGALIAALLVPHVVAAPAVGVLTDRARRPRWILAAAALGFGGALACVAVGLGRVPPALPFAVLLAGGSCGPALTGGLTSQLSALLPEASLPRAFGLDSLSYNVSGIAGPGLAGLLCGVASPAVATLALAACAACGAVVVASLPIGSRSGRATGRTPRLRAGALAMLRDRVLAVVTAASALGQIGPGALPVVATVVAARHHSAAASGWLLMSVAGGALVGSLAWTWRPSSAPRAPLVVMAGLIGVGAPVALASGADSLPVTAALLAASGFFTGPFAGALFTTRQRRAPEELQAQVFTLGAGLKTTAAAAGAALAGTVQHAAVSTQLLLVAASPMLAGVAGAALLVRGVRTTVRTGEHASTRTDGRARSPA